VVAEAVGEGVDDILVSGFSIGRGCVGGWSQGDGMLEEDGDGPPRLWRVVDIVKK
jgi:hypothetical protein